MSSLDLKQHPHRRFNPLTNEWVLVSPDRTQRPWLGEVDQLSGGAPPAYDPTCYMCPGNLRAAGIRNPNYRDTFVFDNDYPALVPNTPDCSVNRNGLIVAENEAGICRVVCFSPRHDLTVSRLSADELGRVVDIWSEQYRELGALPFINHVQIFENRGAMMGASNPHPHCQIWANACLPNEPAKEQLAQQEYRSAHDSCLLCDYLMLERELAQRIVCENDFFSGLVPFWAVWPFEILVLARHHRTCINKLVREERCGLADILKRVTTRYDHLFEASFPYSMGFHQQPTDGADHLEWHLHAHFYPPLLRSATVRKFMVGYEILGSPQRDITPETAAARLREMSAQR
jgi:UDPglucose--hexose-1-phosphate uridylyltransferase